MIENNEQISKNNNSYLRKELEHHHVGCHYNEYISSQYYAKQYRTKILNYKDLPHIIKEGVAFKGFISYSII